jgi:F-type H+-transporting ATPase subunit epsilon
MAEVAGHTLQVSVVSADQEVWSGTASMVVARTVEGEIGILPGHQPILAILAAGEVRITTEGSRLVANAEDGDGSGKERGARLTRSNSRGATC